MKTYFEDLMYANKVNWEFNKKHWKGNLVLGLAVNAAFIAPMIVKEKLNERKLNKVEETKVDECEDKVQE